MQKELTKMPKVMHRLGWLLIVLGGISFFPYGAVSAGVLIALGSLLLNQSRVAIDLNDKQSLFYLESCIKAYEEARLLLDGNNDRATWIAAGRALMVAKELSNEVTVGPHRIVLELHQLKYRSAFYEALAVDKTASFFYGVDSSLPLDRAAEASTAPEDHEGRITASKCKELSATSLYAVWEAAQWPKNYKDPLDKMFSLEQRKKLVMLFPALDKYLEHKDQNHSAAGVCTKKGEFLT